MPAKTMSQDFTSLPTYRGHGPLLPSHCSEFGMNGLRKSFIKPFTPNHHSDADLISL